MPPSALVPPLEPGLAVIHANRLESLRELVVAWLEAHPLAPLEDEVVLVQSNGMAQWIKLALAEQDALGICAALRAELPARFLWHAYQAVLGPEAVPEESPFAKPELGWRVFRLLPGLLAQDAFTPLRRFLADDEDIRKRHQLAQCLADLLDQYQVYRADWLDDWEQGADQLRDAFGQSGPLPPDQAWQPQLWRALIADLPEPLRQNSRALLHRRFLKRLRELPERPAGLPRRIVVFGISSLPQQSLAALAELGRFCQILLCVQNPCRYYWADIVEHKELLRALARRQPAKAGMPAELSDAEVHLHANPLLAAWGKQGRDYIRLLDEFDEPERYRAWFRRIDLFEDCRAPANDGLLQQVQQAILDLAPLPSSPDGRVAASPDTAGIAFHLAHSRQREVEVLHDQLLALFVEGKGLRPRDVIVMVPDIDAYAPHIRAVFGRLEPEDPRHIPFSLSDQRERGRKPLLIALEVLLHLPEARFGVSELMQLLDVPAVRVRFGIAETELPRLHQWVTESGIRWGLDGRQRQGIGLPDGLEQNTWRFGLRRMMLGYAVGSGAAFHGIEPYDEVGGLDAALVGPLADLLDALEASWVQLREPAAPADWAARLEDLLERFFAPAEEADELLLERLWTSLDEWTAACQRVGLDEALPLAVVREAWLGALDEPSLSQRFLAGRVNFCTLMPMRAIPFEVVCVLGMNDGDYPRSPLPVSFDLMAQPGGYRPGDRSRRDDDRYLFLEALLSARRLFYLSWVGRSVQDNSPRPPSVLVARLRDYLEGGWRLDGACGEVDGGRVLLGALTVEHPLQPFSARYFLPEQAAGRDPRLFTYAHEWRKAHGEARANPEAAVQLAPPAAIQSVLSLDLLSGFLRHPVKAFFTQRLGVWFEPDQVLAEDQEPFGLDALERYQLGDDLLRTAAAADDPEAALELRLLQHRRQGLLPLGGFAEQVQRPYADAARNALRGAAALFAQWPLLESQPCEIALELAAAPGLRLEDWLPGLRRNAADEWAQIEVRAGAVVDKDGLPRHRNLVAPWVRHLAGCAAGLPLHTLQVGADGVVALPPLAPDHAQRLLDGLASAWLDGLARPLPVTPRTAFAWLAAGDRGEDAALRAMADVYLGGWNRPGEVQQDGYLARAYPGLENLLGATADGRDFGYWAERLYQPLFAAALTGDEA
ncbi:MAG: exodeoxyribonuclease V subunit gamma [Methylococcaceae bacterium]|nr:exodeoxyribonuclease V subunit gamma [Methylococcaceae bacterium]